MKINHVGGKQKHFLRQRDADALANNKSDFAEDPTAPPRKKGVRETLSGEGNLTFYEETVRLM